MQRPHVSLLSIVRLARGFARTVLGPLATRLVNRILKVFPGLAEAPPDVFPGPFVLAVSHAHASSYVG